jgi:hypothetical protein
MKVTRPPAGTGALLQAQMNSLARSAARKEPVEALHEFNSR